MDDELFAEVVSCLKYFRHRSLIIQCLSRLELSPEQASKLRFVDTRRDACAKIEGNGTLCGRYSIHNTPPAYQLIFRNIIAQRNLENCFALSCKHDFGYLKVACLYLLYLKSHDRKFLEAGARLALKYRFGKLVLFGKEMGYDGTPDPQP